SVPFISPSGVTSTAALSSKQTRSPLTRRTGYFCLTMTAPKVCFLRSGGPRFTTQMMWSPTEAAGYLLSLVFAFDTMIILRVLAPVLSAQVMTALRGRALVMYVLNSSTPFAETALDLVDIPTRCSLLAQRRTILF